jgi:hypothetical protein
MVKIKPLTYFCTKCGTKLIWQQDYAEKHCYINWGEWVRYDRYNARTGERQIVGWWECPKYRWWNGHDSCTGKLLL